MLSNDIVKKLYFLGFPRGFQKCCIRFGFYSQLLLVFLIVFHLLLKKVQIVITQPKLINSKQLGFKLDKVSTWNPPHPTNQLSQTFKTS